MYNFISYMNLYKLKKYSNCVICFQRAPPWYQGLITLTVRLTVSMEQHTELTDMVVRLAGYSVSK